jgi:NADPH:quinone reductase-like Zn-dependent oxidoreductase
MRAVICKKYGSPEVLEIVELPRPVPGKKECLVRIQATAVNSGDVRVRGLAVEGFKKLLMQMVLGRKGPRKQILGTVFSGVIEEIGSEVTRFRVGDKVYGMTGFGFGTYAEYLKINSESTLEIMPKNLSFEESVSLVFGGSSAHHFFYQKERNRSGLNTLIYGATGSVGIASVQIALNLGHKITAVAGPHGKDLLETLGVDRVYNYRENTWIADLESKEVKFNFIFDAFGVLAKDSINPILAPKGTFATVGGWEVASETREQLIYWRDLAESEKIKPVIDKIFSWKEIRLAHEYVDSNRKKGNVIIQLSITSRKSGTAL